MISQRLKDLRKGYRLTEEAYKQVSWTEDNPCYCSACSCPPCGSCEHGLSEEAAYEQDWCWEFDPDYDDEAWELEEEPNEMSREQIVNKGGGNNTPHKFKVGDKVRRTGCSWSGIIIGNIYTVSHVAPNGDIKVSEINTVGFASEDYFELVHLPEKEPPQPKESFLDTVVKVQLEGHVVPTTINAKINLNQQEESNMSNANRRVVNVKLLDNDSGLPVEYSLVAQFDNIVTEDSNEVTVQEILLNKNIADAIAKHNQKRVEQTNLEILNRTGNEVKLRQVKLKDLTWVVTTA